MKVSLARSIDYWFGIPICFLLSFFYKIQKIFIPRSSKKAKLRKIIFLELSEIGSAILAYSAMEKAKEIYPELSYLPDAHIDKKDLSRGLKEDLRKVGILSDSTKILTEEINDVKYGYPIYDIHYNSSRDRVIKYLTRRHIIPCGRYGS